MSRNYHSYIQLITSVDTLVLGQLQKPKSCSYSKLHSQTEQEQIKFLEWLLLLSSESFFIFPSATNNIRTKTYNPVSHLFYMGVKLGHSQ